MGPDGGTLCRHGRRAGNLYCWGRTFFSDRLIPHPDWNGDLSEGVDIGLVHLSGSIEGVVPSALFAGDNERGLTATLANLDSPLGPVRLDRGGKQLVARDRF